jgi:phosphatidyl-myo-inositol dimannoside synthase
MSGSSAIFTSEFPPYPGGIGTYTFELARAAQDLGLNPVVFAPIVPLSDRIPTDFEVDYWAPSFYRHYQMPKILAKVTSVLRRDNYDTVIAADLNHLIPLAIARTSAKKIAVIHGTDAKSRIIGYINKLTSFRPYNAYDAIASNSAFSKNLLLCRNPSVESSRVVVAPLGVSKYWYAPVMAADVSTLTARFSLSTDRLLLLSVGRIEPRKGMAQAVAAISRLPPEQRRRITYVIAGRTVDSRYVEALLTAIRAADADIRLVGTVSRDELRALYHRADLLMHTATMDPVAAEGFGLVFLEAAACGLPTLATRVDAIPEVVLDGINGLLVEDGDLDAISNGIARSLKDRSFTGAMAASCKAHAANYTWERCARITFGLDTGLHGSEA